MTSVRQESGRREPARSIAVVVLLISAFALGSTPLPADDDDRTAGDTAVDLPQTFAKVWYRPEKSRGLGGGRTRGLLTLDRTGIRFESRKREVDIPIDSIHRVSWGKMRGDVDTSWVVLSIGEGEDRHRIGFRDGKKFGYGNRSREIFEAVRDLLRATDRGQYRAPEGYEVYDGIARQLTLAHPAGWFRLHRTLTVADEDEPLGVLVLSPHRLSPAPDLSPAAREEALRLALEKVDAGRVGAIFVARQPAGRGMTCGGFSEKARARLLARVAEDPLFDGALPEEESVRTEPGRIDGCESLRVVRRSRSEGQAERVLDVSAVVHESTLYLFGLRTLAEKYDTDRTVFEKVIETVSFSVAQP